MKKTVQLILILLPLSISVLHAQSWGEDNEFLSRYIYPDKWVWVFPKNIESFKTANTQYWRANQWRDSLKMTHTYATNGLPQSLKGERLEGTTWQDDGTAIYTFDANNRATQIRIGLGTPTALLPLQRYSNSFGTGGRLDKTLIEENISGVWEKSNLDSNVYSANGRLAFYYNMNWSQSRNTWRISSRDSLVYDANGRLDKTFVEEAEGGYFNLASRLVNGYNAANKLTTLRFDVPQSDTLPIVFDTAFAKINLAYDAQNRMNQLDILIPEYFPDTNITILRYKLTLNANGKVTEELGETYNNKTKLWQNFSKTTYTYFVTGTQDILSDNGLTIAPNPTQNQVAISFEDKTIHISNINMYDLQGRLLQQKIVDNQPSTTFNTEGSLSGTYFLKIDTNKGFVTKSIVVQH
jgi:hypothetical protein